MRGTAISWGRNNEFGQAPASYYGAQGTELVLTYSRLQKVEIRARDDSCWFSFSSRLCSVKESISGVISLVIQ